MSASKTKIGDEIAVFTRNHPEYLDDARKIGSRDPNRRVTFRAATRWVTAAAYLSERGPRKLYIAPIGGDGTVDFVADLCEVYLDPKRDNPRTNELLTLELPRTKGEGLWEDHTPVRLLYVIKNCRRLEWPFSMNELVKVSNGKRISTDYGYSYSVVYSYRGH